MRLPRILTLSLPGLAGLVLAFALTVTPARAEQARIAVAANFTAAAQEIGAAFTGRTGHEAVFSFASTGQLYTQIAQGAPYDAFLAADRERPQKAEAEGHAVAGSRFTYATGRIVLYSREPGFVTGRETLQEAAFTKIAIANPATAPYGAAAVAAMTSLGVYDRLEGKIVRGNNIAQTYQFVATGNAELGFVALSQIAGSDEGSRWVVPGDLHPAIAQDAVLLARGADNPAARAFLDFLRGPEARAIKDAYGYDAGD